MTALAQPQRRGWSSLLWPGIATALCFLILVGLGTWQVERLAWKENLLAEIGARIHAAPRPLPARSEWPTLAPERVEYLHVTATGTFEHEHEAYLFRAAGGTGAAGSQPGYQVLTPLRLTDGAHVIINRGFVPLDRRDPATRMAGQVTGPVTLTGLLRMPEARNPFTPPDDPARNIWFTRDPAALGKNFGLQENAPFSIDADAAMTPPGGLPVGGATVLDVPNNHLSYAVTWYGLALSLLAIFALFARRRLRGME
jgi:surfeit locus 1 family protein